MKKIKRNDEVIVIAGRDKGQRGEVSSVLDDGRLIVAGVNMVTKHKRPNPNANEAGGRIQQEAPIQASNVAIYNRGTEKADRVGFRFETDDDGKQQKVRFYKSNNETIDD